jgi:hypothetical protein
MSLEVERSDPQIYLSTTKTVNFLVLILIFMKALSKISKKKKKKKKDTWGWKSGK